MEQIKVWGVIESRLQPAKWPPSLDAENMLSNQKNKQQIFLTASALLWVADKWRQMPLAALSNK